MMTHARCSSLEVSQQLVWDLNFPRVMWLATSFLLLLQWICHADGQFIQPDLCNDRCYCSQADSVIDCNRQDRLGGLPTNIPTGISKLYIQHGEFRSPSYLTRANLTGLEQLVNLRIIYSNLESLESRAFLGMSKLKHLDLSHNALLKIDAYTFYGLQLVNLYLQEQQIKPSAKEIGLLVAEDAFHGLTATQINLRGNSIRNLAYQVIAKVTSLERLILSENLIQHLDEEFSKHFDRPNRLLDLTANPLRCSCSLAWLASHTKDWMNQLPGLNITCLYEVTRGRETTADVILELSRLTAEQLCPASRIHTIGIDVFEGATMAALDCTAVSISRSAQLPSNVDGSLSLRLLSQNPPGVAWQYIEAGHLREVRRLASQRPLEEYVSSSGNSTWSSLSSTVRLNVSLKSTPRKFTCTTWDALQEAQEVVVTLRGPSFIPEKQKTSKGRIEPEVPIITLSPTPSRPSDGEALESASNSGIVLERSHYLFQKQFSLLEMAGAVIGTFLSTVLFLLIGAHCFRIYQRKTLFRLSSSDSSVGVADVKGAYLISRSAKNGTPTAALLASDKLQDRGAIGCQLNNPPPIPQQFSLNTSLPLVMSPQLGPGMTLNSRYLTPAHQLIPTAPSSASGTDEQLQQSLALLTSPFVGAGNLGVIASSCGPSFSPALSNGLSGHPMSYWPAPPSSPYSATGSHVYDVPRDSELLTPKLTNSNTVDRVNFVEIRPPQPAVYATHS